MHYSINSVNLLILLVTIGVFSPINYGYSAKDNVLNGQLEQINELGHMGQGGIQTLHWEESSLFVRTTADILQYVDLLTQYDDPVPRPLQPQYAGEVIAESFTGNNALYALQTDPGVVEVTGTNRQSIQWRAHSEQIISAAISPETDLLAVARLSLYPFIISESNDDFDIRVWSTTGEERFLLQRHMAMVTGLTFSPNGRLLVSNSNDGTIRIWDMTNGQQLMQIEGHGPVTFDSDGSELVFTRSGQVIIYDINTQETISAVDYSEHIEAFSLSEQQLAVGSKSGKVSLYNLSTMEETSTWDAHTQPITSLAWAPDGIHLASATRSELKVWNTSSNELLVQPDGFSLPVRDVEWIDDETIVSSESFVSSAFIRAWNPNTQVQIWKTPSHFGTDDLALGPENILLVGNYDSIEMLSLDSISSKTILFEDQEIRTIAFAQNLSLVAIARYDWIEVFDIASQNEIFRLEGHKQGINALAFSPDNSLLASGSGIVPFDVIPPEIDNSVRLWDIETGQQLAILSGVESPVLSLVFSPVQQWLVSGHADGTIQVWDVATASLHLSWKQEGAVEALAFHPDGDIFASGSQDRKIRLWILDSDQPIATFEGHMDAVSSLDFSEDGEYLASGSLDGTVRLWQMPIAE